MTMHRGDSLRACLAAAAVLTVTTTPPALASDQTSWIDDLGIRAGTPLLMLPPAAGAVLGIDEQRKIDSYTQTMTLQGDAGTVGENNITVTITRNGLAPRIDQQTVSGEEETRMPAGMAMAPGASETRNGLGLFGSSWGRRAALTCLYAWQSVDLADRWISGHEASLLDEQHALSIRVRLCRTGVGAGTLIAMMQGLQSGIGGRVSIAPAPVRLYGDALSAASGIDEADLPSGAAPITGPTDYAQASDEKRRPVARGRHHMRAVARRTPSQPRDGSSSPPPRTPMAGMPIVPLPQ